MGKIAVIDTETNWNDEVMSIGTIIADAETFLPLEMKYHVLPAQCQAGGKYTDALFIKTPVEPLLCSRDEAIADLRDWFRCNDVQRIYAYNARFDLRHLPELKDLAWYDIMEVAAYRQTNPKIPADAECCKSGRLKRDYNVECMLRSLTGNCTYTETHNAICDVVDELQIMRLIGQPLCCYKPL